MKTYIIYILFFTSLCSYAQLINIGHIEKIQSEQLQEKREYFVYLPEHYSNEKYKSQHYPVIYLLDGEKFFHALTGIVNNLSSGFYPVMPECIVVAIKNTNRSRDLTPTVASNVPYKSGGANNFEAFIIKELMPKINKTYRTLNYNILVGHSFGGLFAINSLFKKPNTFNAYITIDPSLWWDNAIFVNELDTNLQTINFNKSTLFLANANGLSGKKERSKQDYAHFYAKKNAIEKMNTTIPKNLNLIIKNYPEEDHGSVVLPAFIDGFRSVFKGYRINVKEVMKKPELLKTHFATLSNNLGVKFSPESFYIDNVVDLLIKRNELENAKILNELNMELYPQNNYLKTKFD